MIISVIILAWQYTAAPSYADFHIAYFPHNRLKDPDNKAVQIVTYMEAASVADIMEEYVKDKDSKMFSLIITSIERKKAGAVIDEMERKYAVKGMGFLEKDWQKELLWFVSEKTYNDISGKLRVFD